MFELTMYPAGDGDCLVLTWGEPGSLHHMVIDGGRRSAWPALRARLVAIAAAGEPLDRLVLTHIDADHIEGLLPLARDELLPVEPGQVWYNGHRQMLRLAALGARQGDEYSEEIERRGWLLNEDFEDGVAVVETAPLDFQVAGLRITMLSPDRTRLRAMAARWNEWRGGRTMVAMGPSPIPKSIDVMALSADTPSDREPPNGSSIAFVAEYAGRRILLAGDAHPDVLAASLAPLAEAEGGRYRVDLFKISHHGSRKNTTSALMNVLDCRRFAISTDGGRHGHPDVQAIARLLRYAPVGRRELYFNYRTARNAFWGDEGLMSKHGFECHWPVEGSPGELTIDVTASTD